jgi:LysM repeat protein
MKSHVFIAFVTAICAGLTLLSSASGQQNVSQSLGVLDEKVSRLSAQYEDLQFRQQQIQKDLDKLQTEVQELRRSAAGVSPADLKALDDRIQAVDAARQKDKQAIIDQLAKELAGLGTAKPTGKPASDTKEHVVQKGENLTAIAKTYGVTVAELKKANNLTGDEIRVGQKLAIPK